MQEATRITGPMVEAAIKNEYYCIAADAMFSSDLAREESPLDLITLCILELHNGYTVVGTAFCLSRENFVASIGRAAARADAVRQVYPLLAYGIQESRMVMNHE